MSHPASITLADLCYDPLYLSRDSELAYLMSFEDCGTFGSYSAMSEKAIHFSPRDNYESPLDSYSYVDFTKETYEKLHQQSQEELRQRTHEVIKAVRGGFKEYFLRAASKTLSACLQHVSTDFLGQYDYMINKMAIAEHVRSDFRLEALKGNVPNKWPESVREFNADLSQLPINAFSSEAEQIIQQFLIRAQTAIVNGIRTNQASLEEVGEMCRALLGVSVRSGNYSVILASLGFLVGLEPILKEEQCRVLACVVWRELDRLLKLVMESPQKPPMQYLRSLSDMGGFGIMKKLHFQKQNYYYNSMTTDGQYLYLFVSAAYGGMFKIGTGENSEAGRVYLHQPVSKVEEVSWVYLKGKLYLRSSGKEAKNLDIIDSETFKTEGSIQLHCPALFGHQIVQNINKNSPLLTDGEHLYIVGKRLTTEKLPEPIKTEEETKPQEVKEVKQATKEAKQVKQPPKEPKQPKEAKERPSQPNSPEKKEAPPQPVSAEQTEKEKRKKEKLIKKKERRKGPEEHVLKLLEFVLFEFDLSSSGGAEATEYENDSDLVKQLWESFSGYFTVNECRKALNINKDDMAGAAQWLVDEGEKERTKRTHTFTKCVVLAQAEVTNEAHQKPLKSANEIQVRDDSVMFPQYVSEYIWTCSRDQVACYCDSGIKVFSKHEKHDKLIYTREKDEAASEDKKYRLHGTYLGTVQGDRNQDRNRRFAKTPEYLLIYDNFIGKYYTFNWIDNEHAFPALVTVSRDYLRYQQDIARRHQPILFDRPPETMLEVTAQCLNSLTRLEQHRFEMESRPNNWLYTYYCVLSEINSKIRNLRPEEAELKKKLINKRNKTVAKMNKILELSKTNAKEKQQLKDWGKAIREVKLEPLFCLNGRIQTLQLLCQLFEGKPQHERLYHQLLDLWVLQADQIVLDHSDYLGALGQRLLDRLKSLKESDAHDQLLTVLLRGFYIFFPKQEQQYGFILSLVRLEFCDFVDFHFKSLSNRHTLFQSFIEELRAEQTAERYENGTDFDKYFGSSYFNTCHFRQVNDLGNLLLDCMDHPKDFKPKQLTDVGYFKSLVPGSRALKEQLLERITRGLQEESEETAIFYRVLLVRAIRYIKEFHNQKFENAQLSALLVDTLRVVEQATSRLPLKSQAQVLRIGQVVLQAYIGSPVSLTPTKEAATAITSLLQAMLRPEILPLLQSANVFNLQGVSQTHEKIMETNHPYDRDRKMFFEPQHHAQALFMIADFDKRCQSDANSDFLQVVSWTHGQQVSNVNANINPFNLHIKMSGKINSKKPYLMLGNQLNMEFHSSGNTRNEHSLNRYGFRVGVRPAFSGKLEFEKGETVQLTATFGGQDQFEEYVFMLKWLTVSASILTENLLLEGKVTNEEPLSGYLEGKIFTQGLQEENLNRLANSASEQRNTLQSTFMKNEHHRDRWNFIARELLEFNRIRATEQAEPTVPAQQTELWNLSGIPAHIKPYIEQIKNYRGNFINLFLEARSHVKDLWAYTAESKRETFTEEYKRMWMMGEALLFLTVLKHSGLLQLSLEFSIEYIKENLQAFEEARNGIMTYFISRMQIARLWQGLVSTYHKDDEPEEEKPQPKPVEPKKDNVTIKKTGKKIRVKLDKPKKEEEPAPVVVKTEKKVKFNPEVAIREELTDATKIKNLCALKKLPFSQDDSYANVTEIINQLQKEKPTKESVYEAPGLHLIRSCLFLLRLRSNNNREQPLANIKPPGVSRSISDGAAQESKIDKNKVVVFREWLENWKKWKGFRKEERVELKFPVKEIVDFINGLADEKEVTEVILHRHRRLQKRIEMVGQLTSLIKVVQGTLLERYTLGTITANLSHGLTHKIEATSESLRKQLETANGELQTLLRSINQHRERRTSVTLAAFHTEAQKPHHMQRLKTQALGNLLLFSDMELPPLDTALYYISFRQMSNTNDQMIQLSNRIAYKALLTEYPVEELVRALWRELGKDTLSMRRWKDVVFIERVLFLLMKVDAKVRLTHLEIDQKELLATVLFYIAYHIEAPLVSKLSIRLIRKLQLRKIGALSTPFDVQYLNITIKASESPIRKLQRSLQVKPYKHELPSPMDNWQILHQRCGENFFCQREPLKESLLPKSESDKKVHILLHLTTEQDICWMINVLYHIEEMTPTLRQTVNWEEYLVEKAKKEQQKDKKEQPQQIQQAQQQQQPTAHQRTEQKILCNIPEVISLDRQLEESLPIGWFLSYNNSFHEFRNNKLEGYRKSLLKPAQPQPNRKGAPNQRRNWQSQNLLKLYKKYEELSNKPLQQPKEADPADEKEQFVKARNFIARMRKHTQDAFILMTQLMNHGYASFAESDDPERTEVLCQLVEFGKQNRLQPIPCEFTKKDYKAKIAPGDILSAGGNSELNIEFVQSSFYPTLQYMLDTVEATAKEGNYTETNRSEMVFRDNQQMAWEELPGGITAEDGYCYIGKELVESRWFKQKRKLHQVVIRDFEQQEYSVVQGGVDSGIKKCTIISNSDTMMTTQTIEYDSLLPIHQEKILLDKDEIVEELKRVLAKPLPKIDSVQACRTHFELKCVLAKAASVDWTYYDGKEDIKEIAKQLTQISKRTTPKKTVKQYEEELQRLMSKLRERSVDALQVISFYDRVSNVHPRLEKLLVAPPEKKPTETLEDKLQTIATHFLPPSTYLSMIDTLPPQIEENKLLKYWQKNILPRIEEFVKSSFKPLEIEEYFQQMRIPLRKHDQVEAIKVAYVLCENKLPPGAVLLDANHDWDSLTLEEATVGRYALLKLPKNVGEASTPILRGRGAEELSLVQIVFVDVRTNNLLVRRRMETLSIIHYLWVGPSSIIPVQTPIPKMTPQEIYRTTEDCLEGVVCGYSKQLLSRLSDIVEVDSVGLVRENIRDRFVRDPVRGWLHDAKEWPLQPLLEKMLRDSDNSILEMLEAQLKEFKAYDTDLFTNELKRLNLFPNATALIISFKRTSKLAMCSGIRFYNDELAMNEVAHVYTGKNERCVFEPIILTEQNIFSRFYSNMDNLPQFEQTSAISKLDATVYGVEPIWTTACFLAEKIGQLAHQNCDFLEQLSRLNKLFVNWIVAPGCYVLRSLAATVIIRLTNRIVHIARKKNLPVTMELLGVSKQKLDRIGGIIKEINEEESKDLIILYSTFLQKMSEMLANIISALPFDTKVDAPACIKELVDVGRFSRYILRDSGKWGDVQMEQPEISQDPNPQWERFMLLENLPLALPATEVRNKVISIIGENKGRILAPALDIYYEDGKLLALVDGWDVLELVEEDVIQKMEVEEQKEQEEEQALIVPWSCDFCTYENQAGVDVCEMCGANAPVAKPKEVFQKVETADLAAAERKLRQKESKRFEAVKQKIKEYVDAYWKGQIDKVNAENNAINEKIKQRAEEAKRRQEREQKKKKKKAAKEEVKEEELKLLPVPEAQPCVITTGSQVLSKPIIENFLERRLVSTPDVSGNILQLLKDFDGSTNLERFKFLEKEGYDLWGVRVSNPNATLLPFDLLLLLMRYVQTEICKETSSVLSYNPNAIRLISQCQNMKDAGSERPVNFSIESQQGIQIKYKRLTQCQPYNIKYSWAIIKEFNAHLSQSMPYISLGRCRESVYSKNKISKLDIKATLGQEVCAIRDLIMCGIKGELNQKITQRTAALRDVVPKIVMERLKIKDADRKPIVSAKQKDEFFLSRAYEQLKLISPTQLRPFKPKGTESYLAFEVAFKGEYVQGETGPYRQFFTDLSGELHPSRNMGLLIQTPNNNHNTGEARSKYMINPTANNSYQLNLFEFLGLLMGCSIRTGAHLALDLPSMLWKQIVGQDVNAADLEEVDERFCDYTRGITECPDESAFSEIDALYWVGTLSDGTEVQLQPNGKTVQVQYKERAKFVSRLIELRLKENAAQIKCLRKGIGQMIPEPCLNCFSGEDLQVMVCGRPQVDVELLKKHTKYSGSLNETSRRIGYFWNVLREMKEVDRLKFIKFCWGQDRLPVNSEQFERNNIRFMIKPTLNDSGPADKMLPRADTCFFNIELPDYSTEAIMRDRIMLAINTDSDSMNAEEVQEEHAMMGVESSFDEGDYEEGGDGGGGGGMEE